MIGRGHAIRIKRLLGAGLCLLVSSLPASSQAPTEGDSLYKITVLRIAPGRFVEFAALLPAIDEAHQRAGDASPFWIRHSQGDHWDFMMIASMDSAYHSSERNQRRVRAQRSATGKRLSQQLEELVAFREDWLARSVEPGVLAERFDKAGLFHIEMFAGLPGKRQELLEQRRMENRYYQHLDRQQNLLFVREAGAQWDAMTIGFYESLVSYAQASVRYTTKEQDEAALAAGFDGVDQIGPYLRSLLRMHRDTLGVDP